MILAALLALLASDTLVPKSWLVIEPVDKSGRRPIRPDAVFAKHLLARDSAPPAKGDVLRGENERDCAWSEATAKDDGTLEGRVGWAYTVIEASEDGVWMAKLPGASQLYVNGSGFVGDPYALGFGGVPVALKKGRNDVYVTGVRGSFRLELWKPEKQCFVAEWDATLPDLVPGEGRTVRGEGAALVVNASTSGYMRGLGGVSLFPKPLSVEKRPFTISFVAGLDEKSHTAKVAFEDGGEREFTVNLRGPSEPRRCTFVSAEDGSVQEYGIRPATEKEQGLVLSLHGAGVDCMGQINSYSSKPEFTILAPTNRRQYGFDWQDWGRTNAYEALKAEKGSIPRALYLTGHSMGGHGTWSLAANDPDAFAAIAPSAGWASFDSYGSRPKGELAELWHAADASSRTLSLLANLVQIPTYVLHGTVDDNVPLREALAMEKALTDAGHPPQFHHQEGAGHWWDGDRAAGADCVDWPDIFELFRKSPPRKPSADAHFLTVDPSIDSTNGWISVLQLEHYGEPAEVTTRRSPELGWWMVTTKNVRCLRLGPPDAMHDAFPTKRVVDGVEFGDTSTPICLLRENDAWKIVNAPPAGSKSPEFSGPFKRAFRNHFVLVYGTQGTEEEDRELYERARCDSEIWWYRGNGRGQVLSDTEYLALAHSGYTTIPYGNAILYGNADTNLAWKKCVGTDAPLQVRRGSVKLGDHEWKGDALCALAIYPARREGDGKPLLFGLVGDTGAKGTRLGYTTAYFVSGVGYPDYTLFGSDALQTGDGGVLATGWFDATWKLDGRGFVRPEAK